MLFPGGPGVTAVSSPRVATRNPALGWLRAVLCAGNMLWHYVMALCYGIELWHETEYLMTIYLFYRNAQAKEDDQ